MILDTFTSNGCWLDYTSIYLADIQPFYMAMKTLNYSEQNWENVICPVDHWTHVGISVSNKELRMDKKPS